MVTESAPARDDPVRYLMPRKLRARVALIQQHIRNQTGRKAVSVAEAIDAAVGAWEREANRGN